MKIGKYYRWYVVLVFFLFLVFHQADRFIISGIAPALLEEFSITYAELGLVFSVPILAAALLYPVWGYLYDKYSRRLLVSAAAAIWGATTWLNSLARVFREFFITRIATGIDDAAPPGIYSLVADYFEPEKRGKAMGFINAAAPLGSIIGIMLAVLIGLKINWRLSFYITGTIGLLTALLVYFTVRDIPRGSSEPELRDVLVEDIYRIKLSELPLLLKNKSLVLLYLQGFFGVFPWNAIEFWIPTYLAQERGFTEEAIVVTMAIWLIAMVLGNIVGGLIGDYLFRKTPRGRAVFGAIVVFLSAALIYLTITAPDYPSFMIFGALTAFEIPMAAPNVSAAITDVTEPELRSSATSALRTFENIGSAVSPLIVGILAEKSSLGESIVLISSSTWVLCGIFFTILAAIIHRDIARLRTLMAERAKELRKNSTSTLH